MLVTRPRAGVVRVETGVGIALVLGFAAVTPIGCGGEPDVDAAPTKPPGSSEPAEPPAPALSAAEILERHVEAIGGRAAISEIRTLRIDSTIELAQKNLRGAATMWWEGGRYRVSETIEGLGTTSAGFDGARVWREDGFHGARELTGGEAELYRRGASPFLVADWSSHFSSASVLGERVVDGASWVDVELEGATSRVVMSFDQATGRWVEMAFDEVTPTATRRITTRNEDYRVIEGTTVMLPHRLVTRAPVGQTVQTVDAVVVNAPIEAERFSSPLDGPDRVPADPSQGENPGTDPAATPATGAGTAEGPRGRATHAPPPTGANGG